VRRVSLHPASRILLRRTPAWGMVPLATWFDVGLAAYLLNPEDRNYTFERLRQALFATGSATATAPQTETDSPLDGVGGESVLAFNTSAP